MSAGVAAALAFNLLFNALGSYGLAVALSSLAARLLRVPAGRWRQLFLTLPLFKVAWDLVRGVPGDSFFWSKVAGARQDLGQFQVGVVVRHCVPSIQLALDALKSGVTYPQSVAELAATLLSRRIGPRTPGAVAAALSAVAMALVLVRVARLVRATRVAEHRRRAARVVGRRALRKRAVDVVVADDYDGVPFLGGVLRPYVCFSRVVYEALTELERDAVVSHELGHLAHHDLVLFAAVGLFADLFWFVPMLRARCRAVVGEAEVCADQWALSAGAVGARSGGRAGARRGALPLGCRAGPRPRSRPTVAVAPRSRPPRAGGPAGGRSRAASARRGLQAGRDRAGRRDRPGLDRFRQPLSPSSAPRSRPPSSRSHACE